jgi:hypothetical protein
MTISVTSQKVCPPSRVRAYKGVHKAPVQQRSRMPRVLGQMECSQ